MKNTAYMKEEKEAIEKLMSDLITGFVHRHELTDVDVRLVSYANQSGDILQVSVCLDVKI